MYREKKMVEVDIKKKQRCASHALRSQTTIRRAVLKQN